LTRSSASRASHQASTDTKRVNTRDAGKGRRGQDAHAEVSGVSAETPGAEEEGNLRTGDIVNDGGSFANFAGI
jgi:hypothetical protein